MNVLNFDENLKKFYFFRIRFDERWARCGGMFSILRGSPSWRRRMPLRRSSRASPRASTATSLRWKIRWHFMLNSFIEAYKCVCELFNDQPFFVLNIVLNSFLGADFDVLLYYITILHIWLILRFCIVQSKSRSTFKTCPVKKRWSGVLYTIWCWIIALCVAEMETKY